MARRRTRFVVVLLLLLPLLLLVSSAARGPAPAKDVVVRTAAVSAPTESTTVLDVAPGAASAIAVSSALFRSAPVVVVATESDKAGIETGSRTAEQLGAPMLLTTAPLRQELARLAPDAVLTVGRPAREAVAAIAGPVPVLEIDAGGDAPLPTGLPPTDRPDPVDATVLLDAGRDDAAAAATARAAGAHVVSVRGGDPRADPAAIDALRATPPTTVLAVGSEFGPVERLRARLDVATTAPQLPGGGQVMLPGKRIVCLYGHPGTPSLGVLGEQDVQGALARAEAMAAQYRPLSDVPVVPAFEIIATVAQGSPGPDGDYSAEVEIDKLRPWVERAGAAGVYVVLDLQPGRADLLAQAELYEPLLRLPHVGLAVDPEWKLDPGQVPLTQIGGVDASEINRTTAWLAELTAANRLPQKLFVVHQFRLSMIRNEQALVTTHDELSIVIHMDGQGTTGAKNATWQAVLGVRPDGVSMGWKNFYDEDQPMLTPEQTMAYEPKPIMISYQ